MTKPRTTAVSDEIGQAHIETSRGVFATFRSRPRGGGLPRGNVLLVPGFTGSKEDFAPLLPLIAEAGWAAAAYDQRGQFESVAQPADDFSLAGLAADVVAVSQSLFGTGEKVHLVGHSFGGLVTSAAVIEEPARWASFTLMCSGTIGFGPGRADLVAVADSVERAGLEAVYSASLERDRANGVEPQPVEVEAFLKRRFLANSPEALAAMARILMNTPDLTPQLAALDVPVALMRGEDDDAWPHALQDQIAADLGTSVVVVAGAAHSPAVEQPEATRDVLARIWLG